MKIIRNVKDLPDAKFCLTIGNFDGFHFGHQSIVSSLKATRYPVVVYTFVEHPKVFFCKKSSSSFKVLYTIEEKIFSIKKANIDFLFLLDTNKDVLNMSPASFLQKYFPCKNLIHSISVGNDFRFGKNRSGDISTLREQYSLAIIKPFDDFLVNNKKVSSSLLRDIVKNQNINTFSCFANANYFFMGKIIKGNGIGSKLTYPTINLLINDQKLVPKYGVYLSKIFIKDVVYLSISNLGINPTIKEDVKIVKLESFLLNCNLSVTNCEIRVELIKFIRKEIKFKNIKELRKQITNDILELKKCYI